MRVYTPRRQHSWEALQRHTYTATAALCACTLFLGLYGTIFLGTVPRSPEIIRPSPVRYACLGLRPPRSRPSPSQVQSAALRLAMQRYAPLPEWRVKRVRVKHWSGK